MSFAGRQALMVLLFLASGATGLIYELVWTRELIFVFGGTTYAITTVLVAFMGGLGLGSWIAGRTAGRLRDAGRMYGALEIAIGLYALAMPMLLGLAEPLYRGLYANTQANPVVLTAARFLISFVILILPTTFMGATLPLLVRFASAGESSTSWIGRLYGINSLGAVAGTLACGFWLMPALGLTMTTRVAAGLNLAIGVAALLLFSRAGNRANTPVEKPVARAVEDANRARQVQRAVLIALAVCGFSSMSFQVAWTRAMVLSIGSSTYSFTCILAGFILGLALGSLIATRLLPRVRRPLALMGWLAIGIGATAVLIAPVYGVIPFWASHLVYKHSESFARLLSFHLATATLITLLPTLLMGALFPVAARVLTDCGDSPARATGNAYGANTLGTVTGSFLAGFLLIRSDVLGAQMTIVVAAIVCGMVGWLILRADAPGLPRRANIIGLAGVAGIGVISSLAGGWDPDILMSAPFRPGTLPQDRKRNQEVIYLADGADMTVAVTRARSEPDLLSLSVNGKPDASTGLADMFTQLLLGHIPMLLSPRAESVCVVGLGSGMTLSAVNRYPQLKAIDCAELSEEVIAVAGSLFSEFNFDVLHADPRVRLIRADGRNHLLLTDRKYDVIISEPSNPWIAGVANLFTREYFQLARQRLNPGGRMCVWLQGYGISQDIFKLVVRTLGEQFAHVCLFEIDTDFILVASESPLQTPLAEVRRLFEQPSVREDLYRIGHGEMQHVLGRYVTADEALRQWAGPGPIHTDDNAILEFSAPRFVYVGEDIKIIQSLIPLAKSPLHEILTDVSADPRGAQLEERMDRTLRARAHRMASLRMSRARAPLRDELREVLAGLAQSPGDPQLHENLNVVRRLILAGDRGLQSTPDGAALMAQVAGARLPTVSAKRGSRLGDVAAFLLRFATDPRAGASPEAAVDYLREAHELSRADRKIGLAYIEAMRRAGRVDEARRVATEMTALGVLAAGDVGADGLPTTQSAASQSATATTFPTTQPAAP